MDAGRPGGQIGPLAPISRLIADLSPIAPFVGNCVLETYFVTQVWKMDNPYVSVHPYTFFFSSFQLPSFLLMRNQTNNKSLQRAFV